VRVNLSKRAVLLASIALLASGQLLHAQGTLRVVGKDYKLEHVVAYETKFFDDNVNAVLLCAKPIPIDKLKAELQKGSDTGFFLFEPEVKLTFDQSGKLLSVFIWADNKSISTGGTMDEAKVEADFKDGKAHGKVAMNSEKDDPKYRFDVVFDVAVMKSPAAPRKP